MYVKVVSLKVTMKLQSGGNHLGEHEEKDRKYLRRQFAYSHFFGKGEEKSAKQTEKIPSKKW